MRTNILEFVFQSKQMITEEAEFPLRRTAIRACNNWMIGTLHDLAVRN